MAKLGFASAAEAVEERQKVNEQREALKFERFKLIKNEAPKRVRFIVTEENDLATFVEHWTEFPNGWTRNFACPNEQMGEDKCIVCRGPKSLYIKDQRKPAHMINLIERGDGKDVQDSLKVWSFSPMAMASILEHYKKFGNVTDRDYNIQFVENEGSNKNANIKAKFYYIIEPATSKAVKLSPEDEEFFEKRYNLLSLIPPYDEENLDRISKMPKGENQAKPTVATVDIAKNFLASVTATSAPSAEKVTEEPEIESPSSTDSNADFLALLAKMNKS